MSNEGKVAMAQGRIVWVSGDLFEGRKKTDMQTKQVKRDQQGNEIQEYGFGLAIPKAELADPTRGALWLAMHEQAFTMFPSRQIPPAFAMKFNDGDGIDAKGQPFNTREGYAGCLVFALTTQLPIRFFKFEGGQNIQINDGIKCGDYVNVQVSVKAHPAFGQGKAGLYLNPMAVQLVAPGKEIINAPTGDQVFGMGAPASPSNYVPPEQPVMPAFQPPPAAAPAFAPPPMMAPAAPAPNFAVLPPAFQPPPGGAPMAVAPAAPAFPAYGGGMPPVPR